MPKIRIIDDLNPEDVAMLQALYSRSAASVDEHLERVKATGSGKFMQSYYVGYGHKSIADCGSTTIFIEGVSLLAAKAIQDWPLYSGQETSTRYIDMSKQAIESPAWYEGDTTQALHPIHKRWMEFYTENQKITNDHVRRKYPRRENEREDLYERAVNARTFDILRGFLPAGITTQLSWHTNLRQAADHLARLQSHPLPEVQQIARYIRNKLAEKYPASGFHGSMTGVSGVALRTIDAIAREEWETRFALEIAYPNDQSAMMGTDNDGELAMLTTDDRFWANTKGCRELLATRPRGSVLPHYLNDLGQFEMGFALDFGSFRDLQRHRNAALRMPLLRTTRFEPWYLDQLDETTRTRARALIAEQREAIAKLDLPDRLRQYYIALGFQVPVTMTLSLPGLLYLFELRSGKTVHPTLRSRMLTMIELFEKSFPTIKLHVDKDPDDWTVRRGEQTITERGAS